jgi:hypothetical protein
MTAWRVSVAIFLVSLANSFAASTIREIDFKNFSYSWPKSVGGVPPTWKWRDAVPTASIRLANGSVEFGESRQFSPAPYAELMSVTYGDLSGDGREEAAVDLLYKTGGTAHWHYLFIYALADGSPKLLAILRSGSRADGGLVKVEIHDHLLVLDFADKNKRTADCCSKGWVRVSYRLQADRFVETGTRSYGAFK